MKYMLKAILMVRHAWQKLTLLLIIGVIGAAAVSARNYLFGTVINGITKSIEQDKSSPELILIPLAVLIISGLIFGIFDVIENHYSNQLHDYLEVELKKKSYEKLSSLSIDYFETTRPGALQSRVNKGIFAIIRWIFSLTNQFITPVGLLIFGLIGLATISGWFILISLIALIANILIFLRTAKKTEPYHEKANEINDECDGILNESFSHVSTIRSLSANNILKERFFGLLGKALKMRSKENKLWRNSIILRSIISVLAYSSAMILAVYLAFHDKISIGNVVVANTFLTQVTGQALHLARFLNSIQYEKVLVRRFLKIFETNSNLPDAKNAVPAPEQIKSIKFECVSFNYGKGSKDTINDISFQLQQNKTIALVGPSGVGKSTITKLLLRFYKPKSGKIIVNDQPIESYTQDSLREKMAIVMQDVLLFNTTVYENIRIAKPKATYEEIIDAAKKAHADEFIKELPKKYNSLVGERGIKLSGGQKQRIAIARAILKNPDLIILDEATSALDSQSERLVQDGIKKLLQGRMSLIIAHRLSTIRHADEILVLEKGRIEERGTHEQLMKNNGLYAKLYKMQSETGKIKL